MATELKPLTEPAEKSDLVVYEGTTTSAGDIGGNTLVDSGLTQANNYWNNMVVRIKSGNSNDQVRRISGFVQATGTITVDTAFSSQIALGTQYDILGQYAGPGGGGDATAANQLLILGDVGDASGSTLTSLYAILGNPAQSFLAMIGYEGVTSLANKLTAARAGYLDNINNVNLGTLPAISAARIGYLDNINQAGLLQVTAARAGYLDELAAANLPADIDLIKADLSGTEVEGTASARNAYSGVATSGETGADVFTISTTTRKKIHFLGVQISGLTAGATATLRMYTKMLDADVSLTKFYSEIFTAGTNVPFVPIVNGSIAIRNNVRVEIQSNNAADTSISANYHCILETME